MKRRLLATATGAVMVVMMCTAASSGTGVEAVAPYLRTPKQQKSYENYVAEQQRVVTYIQAVAMQQLGDYLKAVALEEYLASLPRINVDVAHWTAINRCEESGTWVNDGWTRDGHFQGGLGMSVDAWNEVVAEAPAYGVTLPPSSNQATPFEQMEGAQLLYNRVGGGGWACKG